jgi:hypothetical protein
MSPRPKAAYMSFTVTRPAVTSGASPSRPASAMLTSHADCPAIGATRRPTVRKRATERARTAGPAHAPMLVTTSPRNSTGWPGSSRSHRLWKATSSPPSSAAVSGAYAVQPSDRSSAT